MGYVRPCACPRRHCAPPPHAPRRPLPPRCQLCPLKGAPGARALLNTSNAAPYVPLAASPRTLGGALVLRAKGGAPAAASLQQRLCRIFLDPVAACAWPKAHHQAGSDGATNLSSGYAAHVLGDDPSAAPRGVASGALAGYLAAAAPPRPHTGRAMLGRGPMEAASEGVVHRATWW